MNISRHTKYIEFIIYAIDILVFKNPSFFLKLGGKYFNNSALSPPLKLLQFSRSILLTSKIPFTYVLINFVLPR